ncbi:hypothetical protein Zmor_004717 [Zophobas morio]|uniref:Ionotropic glutamate receptor L-glutamate and glycine-binding domain-containing protein n=1 Tax=Zophobas morio TaxID=2755281 RepID=A0AA38MKV1_9CUCU|nr:hypothetical protein Zmor_004717 [Zophobas morio]
MLRRSKNLTGNRRFHGFCVDVLERISSEVGFDYLLDLVPDRKYGARDPVTGQWNGMVRELMQHEQPYVMLKTQDHLVGNERYEGFCIDLLREIASMVGFEYRIELVPDSKYGVIDLETGEWNGIVRQLMDKVGSGAGRRGHGLGRGRFDLVWEKGAGGEGKGAQR